MTVIQNVSMQLYSSNIFCLMVDRSAVRPLKVDLQFPVTFLLKISEATFSLFIIHYFCCFQYGQNLLRPLHYRVFSVTCTINWPLALLKNGPLVSEEKNDCCCDDVCWFHHSKCTILYLFTSKKPPKNSFFEKHFWKFPIMNSNAGVKMKCGRVTGN